MNKLLVVLAVLAAVTTSLVAAPGAEAASGAEVAPEVVAWLASAGPGEEMAVIVHLHQRADLSAHGPETRAERNRRVVQALQATAEATQGGVRGELQAGEAAGTVSRWESFWVINAVSATAQAEVIEALAQRPEVAAITSDQVAVEPTAGPAEPNVALVQAPTLWAQGLDGSGVVVATLDSGADANHPDLAGRYRGGTNSWFDPYGQHSTPADLTGHGTATLGVLVGGDAGGTSIGVAPGAQWVAAKIFDDSGQATATAIHASFQWVLDPDGNANTADGADIVNNSWTLGTTAGCDLSFQGDLQALRAAGVVPVFAAGNFGPGSATSASPANNPEALAVGAVANDGTIYSLSSRGPSSCGEAATVFPELVAPGVNITTAERFGLYQTTSGTSIAAPHVAGALALLLQADPQASDTDLIDAVLNGAVDHGPVGPDDTFGHGLLDVDAAHQWLVGQPPGPFADGFESGDFSAWTAATTGGGALSVTGAAALDGAFGMEAAITSRTALFVTDESPEAATIYEAHFDFDPNGVSAARRKGHDLLVATDGSGALVAALELRVNGGYEVRAVAVDDRGRTKATSWVPVSDAPHQLGLVWNAASTPNGRDGAVSVTVDGAVAATASSIKNGPFTIDTVTVGPQGIDKNVSGTEYYDDYVTVTSS